MGDDLTVVNAARVSFDKQSEWEYEIDATFTSNKLTQSLSERDDRLVNYLAKHGHWTPFSHPQITLRETVPIFVARQRFKHVVGFSYNEVSRRYVEDEPKFFYPKEWRKTSPNKKQGSLNEPVFQQEKVTHEYEIALNRCYSAYRELLVKGVAPEQARMVLPQSMYTSYYVTGSLSAWARAYKLRSSEDAQSEIRELATDWDKIIRPLYPKSWETLIA